MSGTDNDNYDKNADDKNDHTSKKDTKYDGVNLENELPRVHVDDIEDEKKIILEHLIASIMSSLLDAQKVSFTNIINHIENLLEEDKTPKLFQLIKDDVEHKIPLLSILPVPHLEIQEAEVNLNLELVEHSTNDDTIEEDVMFDTTKVDIFTSYDATHVDNERIKIRIVFKNNGIPTILQSYLDSIH